MSLLNVKIILEKLSRLHSFPDLTCFVVSSARYHRATLILSTPHQLTATTLHRNNINLSNKGKILQEIRHICYYVFIQSKKWKAHNNKAGGVDTERGKTLQNTSKSPIIPRFMIQTKCITKKIAPVSIFSSLLFSSIFNFLLCHNIPSDLHVCPATKYLHFTKKRAK